MRVVWTRSAERHLDSIYEYIAQDSPRYALTMVDRLTERSDQLARFPLSGRCVPEVGDEAIREVLEGSYRLIYRVSDSRVDVLAVLHGAMLLDNTRFDD